MPGGISSGAGSDPSSAGTAARAGCAVPAQLVTHTSSDTSCGGRGLRGQCRACCAHAECQLQPCHPCTHTTSSPCFSEEWGQQEQKTHLESNTTSCFLWSLEVLNSQVGKPIPGTLLHCHCWQLVTCGERKLEGFSAQI